VFFLLLFVVVDNEAIISNPLFLESSIAINNEIEDQIQEQD